MREVGRLRARVRGRLIVLGGVPNFQIYTGGYATSPYECVSKPMLSADCATTPLDGGVQRQHRRVNAAFKAALGDGIQFLDPFDALCDEKACRNFDDHSHPIYSDSAHLSEDGAVFVVRRLSDVLDLMRRD